MSYEDLVTRLRKRAKELPERFSKNEENIRLFLSAAEAIEELLAADVRPVERGVWRKIKYRSICRDCSFRGFASWKYCPNCGRQMTTEGDNG